MLESFIFCLLKIILPVGVRHAEQPIFELYDEYTHSGLPHPHLFWKRLAQLAGETTAALALLLVLENNYGPGSSGAGCPADDWDY